MKNIFKGILFLTLFGASLGVLADDCCNDSCASSCNSDCGDQYAKTYFHPREAGTNLPLRMVGTSDKIHLFEKECEFYGVFSVAVGYERSTGSCGLGKVFSFNDSGTTTFGGDTRLTNTSPAQNNVPTNDSTSDARSADWGLSGTYGATIKFDPSISKVLVDFDLWVGLDEFINGMWARVSAPVVYQKNDLDACVSTTAAGGDYFAAGFVDNTSSTVQINNKTLDKAWQNQVAVGDIQASSYGKLPCKSSSNTRLGALDLELGYDLVRNECARLGMALKAVAPTGNKPEICTLFDAVAGTFNWQLGGTIGGSWVLWNCNDEQALTLYGKVELMHLFKRSNKRLYGLQNLANDLVAGSSYLLLKQFDSNNVYDGKIQRATNLLARDVKVGNSFMTDFALMLQYRRCAFDLSVGYNFWYRSKDKASDCSCSAIAANTYGIKGVDPVGDGSGTVDNNFFTKATSNINLSGTQVAAGSAVAGDYVVEADVCAAPALAPSAYSNKIFGYLGYNWDSCDYTPYLGIAGMYEWANKNRAADQWGLYIKGGLSF